MQGPEILDVVHGVHYLLAKLENEQVQVMSGGTQIHIGIKNERGVLFSWITPQHPFLQPPERFRCMKQGPWEVEIVVPTPEEMRIVLQSSTERHTLTLLILNVTAHPKPVKLLWESVPLQL